MLSSLSTKAMGLAWLVMIIWGFWAIKRHGPATHDLNVRRWVSLWTLITFLALSIKLTFTAYWGDPWGERHGELRLFLGALAVYGLTLWRPLGRNSLVYMAHALCVSSAFGLIWVITYGRAALPANAIPWAGGMAMISVFLLALSLKSDFSLTQRRLWFLGGLLAVMAVLASQSRGAYGIVFWWLAVSLHHLWTHRKNLQNSNGQSRLLPHRLAWLSIIVLGLAILSQTPIWQRPVQSVQDALSEMRVSYQSTAAGANSSVGARLYMWQNSLIAIQDSPWIGHGHDTRKKLLLQWAQAAQSDEVKRLGHVHNEYLHQWIDHGIWGLISQLLYLAGLLYISWRMHQKGHRMAALSLAGVAFIHLTSSLTNVNFAHNYYTSSLSFFIGLSLWLSRLEPERP